ncbi:unnamed protein product, partial [Oppiella nova]
MCEAIDIRKHVGAFAMDVISRCAYGIDVESIKNPNHPLVLNARKILSVDASIGIVVSALFPALGRLIGAEPFDMSACRYFDDLTKKIIDERKLHNNHKANSISKRRTDFIQLMIDSEKSDKDFGYDSISDGEPDDKSTEQTFKKPSGTLSIDEMVAQGILFFVAGYDTTSAALTHAIYYLTQHPECQQKLYDELKTCDEFTYEKLVHLKYLNAVINETLRFAPSFLRLFRVCVEDYPLGNTGITIPAGTSMTVSTYTLHRDPKYWDNPNDFLPERWIQPKHHPYAYMPFGGGPRLCI